MKKKNNYSIYIINILIVIAIFIIAMILNKLSPFGNKMFSISDSIAIFKPKLFDLIYKIKTNTILNYSFNTGLGTPLIFDIIYLTGSPINFIALLFKNPDSMYLSATLLKLVIASITMTFYTSKKTDNKYVITIATICYVFSSWMITYYYYLPWLDIFMIFPLFQYGLEQLLDNHKYHIYIFSLSYMIATNLYICFSVCIYTIIYFIIYEILYKKSKPKEKLLTFDYIALATIGSFLLSSFYLYGWFDTIIKAKLGFNTTSSTAYTISFMDFLKSFYYSNISFVTEMEGSSYPNISCPSIILISYIYYFINNKNIKNKIYVLVITLLCIAIIFIPQLDFIMNAFHKVRGLTYRYSFIISFLMISLFINTFKNLKTINKKHLIISIIIVLIGLLALYKNMYKEILIINIAFILSYLIIFSLYSNNKIHKLLIVILVILQAFVTRNIYFKADEKIEIPDLTKYNLNNVKYRINYDIPDNSNEYPYYYLNNKTTYLFSSIAYSKVVYLFSNLGNITFDNTYMEMKDSNIIPSLLLNVKSKENTYYLEKIYSVNNKIKETQLDEYDIKYNIESIIFNMTGIKDIYNKEVLQGKIEKDEYVFNTNNNYYLIEAKNENGGTNIISQEYKVFNQEKKYGDGTATIYTVKEDKLKDIYNNLRKNQIEYTYYNDNHIIGNINVDKDQLIFTSIPYDKDWEVYIDNKKVEPIELLDSLLGIEVKPGLHKIELKYKTHYLIPILISITTLIVLIIDLIRKRTLNN